jgi:hypothetical protein
MAEATNTNVHILFTVLSLNNTGDNRDQINTPHYLLNNEDKDLKLQYHSLVWSGKGA